MPSETTPEHPGRPGKPRRKRYRGSHPRRFDEKYKELDPDRFPGELAKVAARGQTPAGTHRPVLLGDVLEVLRPGPGHVYLDATLGHGGHLERIAERVLPGGRLIGVDLDPEALESTTARLRSKGVTVSAHRCNFAGLARVLVEEGLESVDLILADLGVSSMQVDDPSRGFSIKHEAPLDLRLDRSRGIPAADWLVSANEEELASVLERHGDEPHAALIAARVLAAAAEGRMRTTLDLVRAMLRAKGLGTRWRSESPFEPHPAAKTFQAVRIALNREDESLRQFLRTLPHVLKPGGRAAVIAFHSGEDRVVEAAFREGLEAGLYAGAPDEPVRAGREEVRGNPRARSARLRWAERAGG